MKKQGADLLEKISAMDLMEVTNAARPIKKLDIDLMFRTANHIKMDENGAVVTVFLDGTEIEWK